MDDSTASLFTAVRETFPHTKNVVYLNSASYGPFCTAVQQVINEYTEMRVRADTDDSHAAFADRIHLREQYASLIGAEKHQVGLGLNTSFGLNIAAFGLPFNEGDEVIVSGTEFPALVYTWKAAAERRGFKLRFIDAVDRNFSIDNLLAAINNRTRALAVSWVQFFNGYKVDLEELSAICRKHNMFFVVDGIQGMGTQPIDVAKSGIDIFSSGCQKWMLSPQGCGFFYLSDEIRGRLLTPFMSWLGVDWNLKFGDLFHYDRPWFDSAEKYELGYYSVVNIVGMKAAVKIFKDLGIENIYAHNNQLIDRLAAYIQRSPYYTVTSSMDPKHRSSIFTFTCDAVPELHKTILKNGIVLVRREGSIRVSVHLFNNEADIDKLIDVLDQFSKGKND